ncbi:MAG: hypothetical protein ACFFDY_07250 [Candidatus Thorarchaeota archaeon]
MKKKRLYFLLYITFIVVLGFPEFIPESRADVVMISSGGVGNFLPEENSNLSMTNASVMFNIDAVYYRRNITLEFNGNYTIYNPGEIKNVILVAPFSTEFKNLETTCEIKVNNTPISFGFLDYNFTDSPWEEYLDWHYMGRRKFITINITFPANNSITIEYSFNAYIEVFENDDALEIFYDVGTSRAWNGTITERVEFKVYGKAPDSYSKYRKDSFEYNCTISDIEDGLSYVWEWKNEIINAGSVYISFSWYMGRIPFILVIILIYGGLAAFCIILLLLLLLWRKKKRVKQNFF